MALWNVDIQKFWNNEYWTNRYTVDSVTLEGAHVVAMEIMQVERAVHLDVVQFVTVRTSDRVIDTDVFMIDNPNLQGLVTRGTNDLLPLFAVARCDFSTAGGGRPSRKYLRLPVMEAQQAEGVFTTSALFALNRDYATPMLAIQEYVDVDGQVFTSAAFKAQVGMRQLRRGSKRKASPVI